MFDIFTKTIYNYSNQTIGHIEFGVCELNLHKL